MADSPTKTLATPLPVIAKDKLIAGKYRIIEEIGHGGMGIVYKAEDLQLQRCVALKFLPPHLMDSPELRERFLIEARAAAALSHPNICVIHEVGESEERPYIAMEYVEGETLRDKLKKGPLKTKEALAAAIQIAAGLADAHGKGIIHRDIKAANIMVTEKGQAKVMDFGLAKLRGGSSLTKSQTTLGTVAYMSPEQARGSDLDQRTDIWSLGVVLYEMLAGRLPFRGDHDQAVIYSILHEEPESLMKARPGTAPELERVVGHTLAKKAAERYQTMEELRGDLEAVAEGLRPLKAERRARRTILGLNVTYFLAAALVVVPALLFGLNIGGLRDRVFGGRGGPEPAIRLAVLPFENRSGDPEQDYLSDGMTDELITSLGRLNPARLQVIGRTSVWRYKKRDTQIDEIGRNLRLDYVLEGSAQREADRLHIRAALIQVRDQTQRWAETYDRKMADIVALQSDVAKQVAAALALTLLPAEQVRLANAPAVNPAAYDAWLKGTQARTRLTREGLEAAERYFTLALEKDPTYAAAWAGMARVWTGRQQMGIAPPSEAASKARAAAVKALALDENSWEAHRTLAGILTWTDWDWAIAEREWDRLLELNPNSDVLSGYSHFLSIMGRPKEALAQAARAVDLDPFDPKVLSFYAAVLNNMRRYDDAIAAAHAAMDLQPVGGLGRHQLYRGLRGKGKYDEILSREREDFAGDRELLEALERGYAEGGWAGSRRRLAEVWAARYGKPGGIGALTLAVIYLQAGDQDRALEWLERCYEEHDPNMPSIGVPEFDALRTDPRFQDLLRRMNLPEVGAK
jgi:TolB-like protein/predicted Ser/Thr protein kinase